MTTVCINLLLGGCCMLVVLSKTYGTECSDKQILAICGTRWFNKQLRTKWFNDRIRKQKSIYRYKSHSEHEQTSTKKRLCDCNLERSNGRYSRHSYDLVGSCWNGIHKWKRDRRQLLTCLDRIILNSTNASDNSVVIPWKDFRLRHGNITSKRQTNYVGIKSFNFNCSNCDNAWIPYLSEWRLRNPDNAKQLMKELGLPFDIGFAGYNNPNCSMEEIAAKCDGQMSQIQSTHDLWHGQVRCTIDDDSASDNCLFGRPINTLSPLTQPPVRYAADKSKRCQKELTFNLSTSDTMTDSATVFCWTEGVIPTVKVIPHYIPGKPMFIKWTKPTETSLAMETRGYIVSHPPISGNEIQLWYHRPLTENIANRSVYRIVPTPLRGRFGGSGVEAHELHGYPSRFANWTMIHYLLRVNEANSDCRHKGTFILQACNEHGCSSKRVTVGEGVPFHKCRPMEKTFNISYKLDYHTFNATSDDYNNMTLLPVKDNIIPLPIPTITVNHRGGGENGPWTFKDWIYYFTVPLMLMVLVSITILVIILSVYVWKIKRKHRFIARDYLDLQVWGPTDQLQPMLSDHPSYFDVLNNIRQKNIPIISNDEIEIVLELGSGAFGTVFLVRRHAPFMDEQKSSDTPTPMTEISSYSFSVGPIADGKLSSPLPPRRCTDRRLMAMKQLKAVSDEKLKDFEYEAEVLSTLDHPNIVTFYGLTIKDGTFALLFEYMDDNSLITFLRKHNPELCGPTVERMTTQQLLTISIQVASGLEYLASRRLVHRDLAARNCLVADGGRIVKLSDFGMSRDIYVTDYYMMESHTMVPIRWLPPETIIYRKFTLEADVWSFAVVLWEIFSHGQVPWFIYSNSEVFDVVKSGRILDRPVECPPAVYNGVMLSCFNLVPEHRPPVSNVREKLQSMLEASMNYCELITNTDHPNGNNGEKSPIKTTTDGWTSLPRRSSTVTSMAAHAAAYGDDKFSSAQLMI